MRKRTRGVLSACPVAAALMLTASGIGTHAVEAAPARAAQLAAALDVIVSRPGGPPGAIVVIQRGNKRQVFTAGLAAIECQKPAIRDCRNIRPPLPTDSLRIASLAKTFSGAAALALVTDGALGLDDTIGDVLPDLPKQWHSVKLRELLNHTSGMPDFGQSPAFAARVNAQPTNPPPPRELLAFVGNKPLEFKPGTRYRYSNSDNIVVGLMVEAASGRAYPAFLKSRVYTPLGLKHTRLPATVKLPRPFIHGYAIEDDGAREDVSEVVAFGGYAWASGGLVSTHADLTRFVRAYVGGKLFGPAARQAQYQFRDGGKSSPPGPGRNAAGLALFRYTTSCGTVYGHTGSILGYTHFIAATRNGQASVTFSVNTQAGETLVPLLRQAQEIAVCLALGK